MERDQAAGARTRRSALIAFGLAAIFTAAFHWLYGDHDLNLRDEGYLWYGVKRVLAGEVPLRDFQAYDPGRYYWCAAFSHLFGSGIIGVRASVAVFECIGLTAGLLVVRRVLRHDAWMIPAALLLLMWMFPRHKLFEHSIGLVAVLMATRLIERPSARRHLAAGVFVGLAAFFGRNHGLYLAVGFALVIALSRRSSKSAGEAQLINPVRAAGHGALGIVLGYSPLLAMLVAVPGFGRSFLDAVFSVVANGANVPKAYPWPWLASHADSAGMDLAMRLALDAAFLLPAVVLPLGLLYALRRRSNHVATQSLDAPLIASLAIGLPYVHHYSVCSDLPHLAQAIGPVLILALALMATRGRMLWLVISTAALLALSSLVALEGNAQLRPLRPGAPSLARTTLDVAGDTLDMKIVHATTVASLQRLIGRHVGPDEDLFIAPTVPTLYPVLGKRSPTWWIYFFWPAGEEEQQAMIQRLRDQDVNWALISTKPFNGQVEYNFDRTNPIVWAHLQAQWKPVDAAAAPPYYTLFRRRDR